MMSLIITGKAFGRKKIGCKICYESCLEYFDRFDVLLAVDSKAGMVWILLDWVL